MDTKSCHVLELELTSGAFARAIQLSPHLSLSTTVTRIGVCIAHSPIQSPDPYRHHESSAFKPLYFLAPTFVRLMGVCGTVGTRCNGRARIVALMRRDAVEGVV